MKTAPSMSTIDFFTFCEMHQLWQAVILKPLKLEECTLHFWKSPIFIDLDFCMKILLDQWSPSWCSKIIDRLPGCFTNSADKTQIVFCKLTSQEPVNESDEWRLFSRVIKIHSQLESSNLVWSPRYAKTHVFSLWWPSTMRKRSFPHHGDHLPCGKGLFLTMVIIHSAW